MPRLVVLFVLALPLMLSAQQPVLREDYWQLGEGLTSPGSGKTIEAGYRMFSVPDFKSVCERVHAADVTRLRPTSSRLRLQIGQPFALSSLKVVAVDASGAVRPKVPIAIESEMWSEVLDTRSDHIARGTVTPIRPGTVRFRVRTICDGPGADAIITAQVTR